MATLWLALERRKQIVVVLAVAAMFAAILAISRSATSPSMALLYSGLDPAAAGEVVAALEQRGIRYEVRGEAIMVDASQRDQLRMSLAAKGLPADNGKGYELLDSLTGFGTTAQMFDAAYWRAVEGELARTIVSGPLFTSARVHIANSPASPFRRAITPSASVTVIAANGGVSAAQAQALRYLISSAVAGMSAADVTIIDGKRSIVIGGSDATGAGLVSDRSEKLRQDVERILEARVGKGNSVVEVNLEITHDKESVIERRLDPDSRVPISQQKTETSTSTSGQNSGAVTVASNLPQNGAGGGNKSSSQNSRSDETINYDVSETKRELIRLPGATRRISVAVLVNEVQKTDPATGETTWAARSPDELSALRDLVASAVGFSKERGDEITLKSMRFEPVHETGTAATVSLLDKLNLDVMRLVQLATLAVVILLIGFFVVRPIFLKPAGAARAIGPGELPSPAQAQAQLSFTGEIEDGDVSEENLQIVGDEEPGTRPDIVPDPVENLRTVTAEHQNETVEVLRKWLSNNKETA